MASAAIAELVIAVCAIAAPALLVLATCIMAELLDELTTMAGTTVVSAGEAQANVTASGCVARDMPAAEETRRAVVNLILGFFDIGKLLYEWSRTAQRRKQYARQSNGSRRRRRGGI